MFKLKLLFVAITTGLIVLLVSRGDISRDFAIGWATGISVGVGLSEFLQRMRR
jgi:hypothetical protein